LIYEVDLNQGCGSGSWKRLNFCGSGSTLKKEAGSGSKLGSIWHFEEPEAEAFFKKHGAGMWKRKRRKRLNFCGSSTLEKEAESGRNSEVTNFIRSWKRKQKIVYCFHIPDLNFSYKVAVVVRSYNRD